MASTRLLVVEDDAAIGASLERILGQEGYEIEWVTRAADALDGAAAADLVVLDLGLPDGDGLDVCRELRSRYPHLGIVVVTARRDEIDVVVGLDAGADDYVTKPFRLAELLARIRARARRRPAPEARRLASGELSLDLDGRRAWLGGAEVPLRPREFDLLALLVANAGQALRRETIVDEVWDRAWSASTKTLDVHVMAIRRKLGDARRWGGITTLRGVGYRLDRP